MGGGGGSGNPHPQIKPCNIERYCQGVKYSQRVTKEELGFVEEIVDCMAYSGNHTDRALLLLVAICEVDFFKIKKVNIKLRQTI